MEMFLDFIVGLIGDNVYFQIAIYWLGFTRGIIKPLFSLVNAIVNQTTSPNDNQWWLQVQASEGMKMFLYFLDWSTSIKIKPK